MGYEIIMPTVRGLFMMCPYFTVITITVRDIIYQKY